MSYTDQESSAYGSQPVEIYTFTRDGLVWRYTSADEDQTVNSNTFAAYPIERNGIDQTQESARSNLTLKVTKNLPVIQQFKTCPPSSVTTVMIQRFHQGFSDYVIVWMGRVTNVKFFEREAEVRAEPIYTSMKRPVLRRRYQTTCPHVLYGPICKVSMVNYVINVQLSANGGTILQSSGFTSKEDGYFSGGFIEWESDGTIERRFILHHASDEIEINLPILLMPDNAPIRVYPGCDHSLSTCHYKFANVENNGGQPFYPGNNPFAGSPIF